MAGRQPNPRAARHRDHRRRLPFTSAFISAATVSTSTAPVIRIRPPVANSISITPALSATGGKGVKAAGVREAIEARGAMLRYLPKYSPDLNPIEMPFQQAQGLSARSVSALALWSPGLLVRWSAE
jgi:hypothetical protein